MRLSDIKLRTFDQCRLRYRWSYMDHDRKGLAEWDRYEGYRFGSAVHGILEDTVKWIRINAYAGPALAPEIIDVAEAAAAQRFAEEDVAERRDEGFEMAIDWLAERDRVDHSDILAIEEFFHVGTPNGHQLPCFMDLVEKFTAGGRPGIRITDYKARTVDHPDSEHARTSRQGQIYTLAAARRYPWAQIFEFRLDYLGSRNHALCRRERADLPYLEQAVFDEFDRTAPMMQAGPWPASTGPWCKTCPFTAVCPKKGDPSGIRPGMWNPDLEEPQPDPEAAPSANQPALF